MTASEATPARAAPGSASARVTIVRVLLLLTGVAVVAWLIASAGAERVRLTLLAAGGAISIVMLLELGVIASDVCAMRVLLGEGVSLSWRSWVRGSALAYVSSALLPSGRAAGEAVRAATFAPELGVARATRACASSQACALLGNAVISSLGALTMAGCLEGSRPLVWALGGNAALCAALGVALLLLLRNRRVSVWLEQHVSRLRLQGAAPGQASPSAGAELQAVAFCVGGRLLQTLEYGVLVHAVGGAASPVVAFAAQGIQLVGAALGDFIPAQMGATEAAYHAFARALQLQNAPASVLSIALAARLAQLAVSGACMVAAALAAQRARSDAGVSGT